MEALFVASVDTDALAELLTEALLVKTRLVVVVDRLDCSALADDDAAELASETFELFAAEASFESAPDAAADTEAETAAEAELRPDPAPESDEAIDDATDCDTAADDSPDTASDSDDAALDSAELASSELAHEETASDLLNEADSSTEALPWNELSASDWEALALADSEFEFSIEPAMLLLVSTVVLLLVPVVLCRSVATARTCA